MDAEGRGCYGFEGGILHFNSTYLESELRPCGKKIPPGQKFGGLENARKMKHWPRAEGPGT